MQVLRHVGSAHRREVRNERQKSRGPVNGKTIALNRQLLRPSIGRTETDGQHGDDTSRPRLKRATRDWQKPPPQDKKYHIMNAAVALFVVADGGAGSSAAKFMVGT
jgi:hypothetical protein